IGLTVANPHIEPAQPEAPVGGALAGLQVVLPAVPGTGDAHLVVGEPLAADSPVGQDHLLVPADDLPRADRAALVPTPVLVGVQAAVDHEDPELHAARLDKDAGPFRDVRDRANPVLGRAP